MTDSILALVALAVAVDLLAQLIRERSREAALNGAINVCRADRNRNRFGELRTRLLAMAREERFSIRGSAFQAVYGGLTMLMREPQHYPAAAQLLMTLPEVGNAASEITPDEGRVFVEFADRLDLLCRDFSQVYRFLAWLDDCVPSTMEQHRLPYWIRMAIYRHSEHLREISEMRTARLKLRDLGQYALAAA